MRKFVFFVSFVCFFSTYVNAEDSQSFSDNRIMSFSHWKKHKGQPSSQRPLHRETLPYPYNTVQNVLPMDEGGWYGNDQVLHTLIRKNQVKVVVELGSWLGLSTRDIARQLPKSGKVYAVDHWEGSEEHKLGLCKEKLPTLYQQFLSNVIRANLMDKIVPMKMTTLEAAEEFQKMKVQVDLIYIDASHDEENVYKDLTAWYPFVEKKGVLCGDDWPWDGVRRAVERFAIEHNLDIEIPNGKCWVVKKRVP